MKPRRRRHDPAAGLFCCTLLLLLLGASLLGGCAGDHVSAPRPDLAGRDQAGPDAIDGRAPRPGDGDVAPDLARGPQLTEAHAGWREPLCFGCHDGATAEYPHKEPTLAPPSCEQCHGYNGAPHQDHAIEENPCASCHEELDHIGAFTSPGDCLACHAQK